MPRNAAYFRLRVYTVNEKRKAGIMRGARGECLSYN